MPYKVPQVLSSFSCHPGVFRWKPCWAWRPHLPQCPRAKSLDPNSWNPEQSPHLRRGGNGKRSSLPLDLLQKRAEKTTVGKPFDFTHPVDVVVVQISHTPTLDLSPTCCPMCRIKPSSSVCFTVPQHADHEGNIQELCGTTYQHCLGWRCDDSTWEGEWWVDWLCGPWAVFTVFELNGKQGLGVSGSKLKLCWLVLFQMNCCCRTWKEWMGWSLTTGNGCFTNYT